MKFLVEITAPADKGPEIDAAGGPGPIVAELTKRFAPEVMYVAADGRTLTFVADLPTALDVAVLMEISSDRLYAYPRLRPVIGVDEMPEFVAKVHELVGTPH